MFCQEEQGRKRKLWIEYLVNWKAFLEFRGLVSHKKISRGHLEPIWSNDEYHSFPIVSLIESEYCRKHTLKVTDELDYYQLIKLCYSTFPMLITNKYEEFNWKMAVWNYDRIYGIPLRGIKATKN